MKQYFLKFSGLTVIVLLMQFTGFCQDETDTFTTKLKRHRDNDEIIIKRKTDKEVKITVEVKDGQVTVNGKPLEDFDDENFSVRKRRNDFEDLGELNLISPDRAKSPFRGGGWDFNGEDHLMNQMYGADSKTAFLGVTTESAENGGTEITEVTKGSAAEKIGLKRKDVITRIGETKVDSHEDLVEAIHQHKPMDKVVITFKRDGKEQKLTATLGKTNSSNYVFKYNMVAPKIMRDMPYAMAYGNGQRPRLGIKAQDTEDGKGVKVLDVDEDSPADKAGVKEGDIITQFEGKDVNSSESLANYARENRAKYILKLKLLRDGKAQDLDIKMPRNLKTTEL